ncbi:MAG: hypothetical protein IJW18_09645 [Lachnospiraceae bacterium]|nr:hypothetical protein [Lachnospiraceae bacterium]
MEVFLDNIYNGFQNMTFGSMLCYGGMAGILLSFIIFLICLATFPAKRRKMLKKLGNEE